MNGVHLSLLGLPKEFEGSASGQSSSDRLYLLNCSLRTVV